MPNATYTGEDTPADSGRSWYKPSTGEWYTYNSATEQWDLAQDGFTSIDVVDLAVSGSITAGESEGLTGEFEGEIKKITVENGIVVEIELDA